MPLTAQELRILHNALRDVVCGTSDTISADDTIVHILALLAKVDSISSA